MKTNKTTIILGALIVALLAAIIAPSAVCDFADDIYQDGTLIRTGVAITDTPFTTTKLVTVEADAMNTKCNRMVNWLRPIDGGKLWFQLAFGSEQGSINVNAGGYDQQTTYDINEGQLQAYKFYHCVSGGTHKVTATVYDGKIKVATGTDTVIV